MILNFDLNALDKEIFLFLNRYHSPSLDHFMFFIRDLILWVPLIFLSLFIYLRYKKNKMRPHSLIKTILFSILIILQVVLCVYILPHVFDPLVLFERPLYNHDISQTGYFDAFSFREQGAFYASKVCAVMAISFFLISLYETPYWLKVSLIMWVLFISYNRIYTGAHYPFNVLVSECIGIGIGLLTFRYYKAWMVF